MNPEEAGAHAADEAIDSLPALPSDLSAKDARELTIRTGQIAATLWESLRRLYLGRAWLALGYASWDDYCTAELRGRIALPREDRPAIVQSLRDAGLSTRAIASAVGASRNTVDADLRNQVAQTEPPDPAPIIGRDGKQYAPPPPKPERDRGEEWALAHDDGSIAQGRWNLAFLKAGNAASQLFAEWPPEQVARQADDEAYEAGERLLRTHLKWWEQVRRAREGQSEGASGLRVVR